MVRVKFLKGTQAGQEMYLRAAGAPGQASDFRVNVADGTYQVASIGGAGVPTVHDVVVTEHTVEAWVSFPDQAWTGFNLFPSVAGSGAGQVGTVDLIDFDMNATPPAPFTQHGRGTTDAAGNAVVVLQAMAAGYSIQLTAGNGAPVTMTYNNDTGAGFDVVARDGSGAGVATSFSWVAVGRRL